jgi:hypothetical protein
MIVAAEASAPAEIGVPQRVLAKNYVNAAGQGQSHHPIGAVVAIGHQHVASAQAVEQRAQQRGLAGLLTAGRAEGRSEHGPGGQAEQGHPAQQGNPTPGFWMRGWG